MAYVCIAIGGLYIWQTFGSIPLREIQVDFISTILAGITLAVALTGRFFARENHYRISIIAVYLALVILSLSLLFNTGLLHSPFIVLWAILALTAAIFGNIIVGLLAGISIGYMIWTGIQGYFTVDTVALVVLSSGLPLLVGEVLWHAPRGQSMAGKRAYNELASELTKVAGKAEVVINAIDDGVIAVSKSNTIEFINPAAQRMIGWDKQDAVGLDYKSVLKLVDNQGKEIDITRDPVARALISNQRLSSGEFSLVTSSNKSIAVDISVSPVTPEPSGAGVIAVFRDVTHARSEERAQAEFISTASHEMRTPVAAIEGYLGLALNPNTAQIDEKAREFIDKAHQSAQHLGRLFQDLLDVSKADDNRLSSNPELINVIEFTGDIMQGLKPQADQKGLELKIKQAVDEEKNKNTRLLSRDINPIYYINVDKDHFREVLSNLIENGIKYTHEGSVIIDITSNDRLVRISVKDTGIGIPKEDQSHLFQKFYRIDNSQTREIGGTGLGLYLSRRLVEQMDGKIGVDSEYGKGSTFFVEFNRIDNTQIDKIRAQKAATILPSDARLSDQGIATQPVENTATTTSEIPKITPLHPASERLDHEPQISTATVNEPTIHPHSITPQAAATETIPTTPAQDIATQPATQTQRPTVPYTRVIRGVNTPLSHIEENKTAYANRSSASLNVPPPRTDQQ